jgi:hypothetical protein
LVLITRIRLPRLVTVLAAFIATGFAALRLGIRAGVLRGITAVTFAARAIGFGAVPITG